MPAEETDNQSASPRQIVLAFDGTNNNLTGGRSDTNVARLTAVLLADFKRQLIYYDPGVGNEGSIPGATIGDRLRGKVHRISGLMFGKGVYENIAEAYVFLMRNWQPGDRIFVFGFSRGAFTARSLAGIVARFGVLMPTMEAMVPTLLHLYFSDWTRDEDRSNAIRDQIGKYFCSTAGESVVVHFVGVWDTVESVGAPVSRARIRTLPTIVGKRFAHVRQALALDEYRVAFAPRPYYVDPTYNYAAQQQSIAQLWWSGAHCDVGGGYDHSGAFLSDNCFYWMIQEACEKGLLLMDGLLDKHGQIDRQAIDAWLIMLSPNKQRAPIAHSETYDHPLWSIVGLAVRDPTEVDRGKTDPPPLAPLGSPACFTSKLSFPQDTCWKDRRPMLPFMLALVGLVLLYLAHGMVFDPRSPVLANSQLAQWQLTWWIDSGAAIRQFSTACYGLAVLMDLGIIVAYSYIVARLVTRAFACVAGLRKVGSPPNRLLNTLGRSAPVLIFSDLAEDGLMLLFLAFSDGLPEASRIVGVLMSCASLFKWLGLVGVVVLVIWGLAAARARSGVTPTPAPTIQPG